MLELTGAVEARRSRAVPRLDGPRARAGHHHQAPIGTPELARPRDQPDRHARPRGLQLRGEPVAGRLRVGDPGGGRGPGIEAQTLANCYQAMENDLDVVAVLNKIDLPRPTRTAARRRSSRCSASTPPTCWLSRPRPATAWPRCWTRSWSAPRPLRVRRCAPPGAHIRLPLRPVPGGGVVGAGRQRGAVGRLPPAVHAGWHGPHRRRGGGATPTNEVVDRLGPGETGYLIAGIKVRRRGPLGRDRHRRGPARGRAP